jgi:hypothetical protein
MQNNSQFELKNLNEKTAKAIASTIEKYLVAQGLELPHTKTLDLAGILCGFANWQGLQAHVASQSNLVEMNFDAFEKEFKPRSNDISRPGGTNAFGTTGAELAFVQNAFRNNPATVWTCTEGDDGGLYVGEGFHYVNVVFYLVTHKPAKEGVSYCVPWDHDLEDKKFQVRLTDMAAGEEVFSCTVYADDIEVASRRAMEEVESELEALREEGGQPLVVIEPLN